MATSQSTVAPLYWQVVGALSRTNSPSLSGGRARPLAVASSSFLSSLAAGPSRRPSPSSSRKASSAPAATFRIGDIYSNDPVLGRRAKLLNDRREKGDVVLDMFEEEVPEQYRSLSMQTLVDDDLVDPKEPPAVPLLRAVRERDWRAARDEFQALHASGGSVPFDKSYLRAAVSSLSDPDIELPEDRLEWFILWASLIPQEPAHNSVHGVSDVVRRRHQFVEEQLLFFPTHLARLSRALILLSEKGYVGLYTNGLLPRIVKFSPPSHAYPLVESVCQGAGLDATSSLRANIINIVAHQLTRDNYLDEAVRFVERANSNSAPYFHHGVLRPTIRLNTYQHLRRKITQRLGERHPHLQTIQGWLSKDYPDEVLNQVVETTDSRLLRMMTDGRPSSKDLPRALRLLARSDTHTSATALSNVLEALYMEPRPRPRLVSLIHRRIVDQRTADGHQIEFDNMGEMLWVEAEMRRLTRIGRPADALSLYAARFQWIGLPASDVWAAYRDYRPEAPSTRYDASPRSVQDPSRMNAPSLSLLNVAYWAIIQMHGVNVDLLMEDYQHFLRVADSFDAAGTTATSASADGCLSSASISSTDADSLFEEPSPSTTSQADRVTAWSAPNISFNLPPSLRPDTRSWTPWVRGFSAIDPDLGAMVLKDMRDRRVQIADGRLYGHFMHELVRCDRAPEAIEMLHAMRDEGGVSYADGRLPPPSTPPTASTLQAVGGGDGYPPVTSWTYVRLIRSMVLRRESRHLSRSLEREMQELGFALTDIEKAEMAAVYALRHGQRVHRAAAQGREPPVERRSPWGEPGEVPLVGVAYVEGQLSGPRGVSFARPTEATDSSNTLLEEGYPLRSRLLKLVSDDHRAGRKANRKKKSKGKGTPDS